MYVRRYPLACAGIQAGKSTDSEVRRRFGSGFFVRNEGHGGGRYYVDPAHRVTLHVEIGVDRILESVSYARGVKLPGRKDGAVPAAAVVQRFSARERIGESRGGFHLGDSTARVLRRLGKPKTDRRSGSERVLRYETDYETRRDVLNYEGEFRFRDGRLVEVRLYNGE